MNNNADAVESFSRDICVLIPAYNPDEHLITLINSLISLGIINIIIVNDGSSFESGLIFERIHKIKQCRVLTHAVNLGKGRALKTGFNYICNNFKDVKGVVTVDADGQHLPADMIKVVETFLKNPNNLVIGSRKFARGTPLRSLLGNILTRYVFRLLVGRKLSDTQSGLRCIPMNIVPALIRLDGEGYEYEMNMLISTKTSHIDIVEQEITTVYLENNRSSHFNPLVDSMKIYFLLLRFGFSSIVASLIDFVVFMLSYNITGSVYVSIFIGRYTIGPVVNYAINKNFVFHSKTGVVNSLIKYYSFASIMAVIASVLITTVKSKFMLSIMLSKILVETFLFLVSFTIQRDYIFNSTNYKTVS